jgi:hypothetical protein
MSSPWDPSPRERYRITPAACATCGHRPRDILSCRCRGGTPDHAAVGAVARPCRCRCGSPTMPRVGRVGRCLLPPARAAASNRMGSGDFGSASDQTRPPTGPTVGDLLITAGRCCMRCMGMQGVSPGGHDYEKKLSSGEPASRISAGHRRSAGVELRGFEPRTFSLRRRVRSLDRWSMRCMSCELTERSALVPSAGGTGGARKSLPDGPPGVAEEARPANLCVQ